ncbi:MAG TPA: UPF0182 family protein [Nocardioides sp.]|uniref:UPF0182 family protein n=1 Tax=Nocardioides sp. TaxID=35761 RepID=UPI002E2EB64E|nr:UPF0182 family protein [Nocardioides sp.]HEX3929740.1 UPF0182 family protein [Nocardioides sp.]
MPTASPARLRELTTSRWKRLAIRLVAVAIIVVAVLYAFLAFVSIRTNELWFGSVHVHDVYGTILGAQILLFVVFGGLTAAAVAASLIVLVRQRPAQRRPDPARIWRRRFRRFEPYVRTWLIAVISLYLGVKTGSRASGRWQTYVLWRNAQPWGQRDPQFHRDISYYVEVLPFHRMVVAYLSSIVLTALVVTVVAGYLYGAWRFRPRGPGRRVTSAFKKQISVLLGLFLLLKAGAFWLMRYGLTTSNRGPVTGMSYTDTHAALPAFTVLVVVAVLCAALSFGNVRLDRLRFAALGVVVLYATSYVVGGVVPNLVYRFRESPSAATLDLTTISRNQSATLRAFGLDHQVTTQTVGGAGSSAATAASAQAAAQIRLLDPNQLTPTFNVKQEQEAYYKFKSTLDIDHYPVHDQDQDVAIAVRELNLTGISRGTWVNRHLVYTHGYGVVAAPTDTMDSGVPDFINGDIPPVNQIPVSQPRVYFGQNSPPYSIVGEPKGSSKSIEFDYPSTSGGAGPRTTYDGDGGVPIGSRFTRFLYAVKLHDPNVFFSSDINSGSQLLTVRNPRARVAKVAPWLTLDGDVYPTVVGGQVDWVVDGYTTTSNYPDSQQVNLRNATTNSLTKTGSTVVQPNTSVNYMQNSVKAVVNAYTGQVTLYEWNQAAHPDPLLKTWEHAFPDLVKPQDQIPADLLPHLRYPQDLFNVQRLLLAHYHVTDPSDFYNGSAFWKVPTDPTFSGFKHSSGSSPTMPSAFMSLSPTGDGSQVYSLSTPMVTLNYRQLAAFLSVDATPGPDYGKFTLLQFPTQAQVESPSQIQNDIESDSQVAHALTLQRGGNSKVVVGNLLTIPLDGKVLYVEPIYTQAQGGSSFPILRHVVAVYGNGQPAFQSTLTAALKEAIANEAASH